MRKREKEGGERGGGERGEREERGEKRKEKRQEGIISFKAPKLEITTIHTQSEIESTPLHVSVHPLWEIKRLAPAATTTVQYTTHYCTNDYWDQNIAAAM